MVFSPSFFHQRLLQFQFSETSANLGKPIMLGEALTPKFGQTFGTFVRSEGPCVALYNRAVVCENYSVITVSLVSQSSAISLSVEMRIPNPKYKGRTRKIPQLRTQPIHVQPYIFCIVFSYRESCVQRLPGALNKFNCNFSQRC